MNLLMNPRYSRQPFTSVLLATAAGAVLLLAVVTATLVIDGRDAHADTAPVASTESAPELTTTRSDDGPASSVALVLAVIGTLAVGTVLAGWQAFNGIPVTDESANW